MPGLKQARLIGAGTCRCTQAFAGGPREATSSFPLTPASGRTWYSVEVEDAAGRKAYTNPIWVDVVELPTVSDAALKCHSADLVMQVCGSPARLGGIEGCLM